MFDRRSGGGCCVLSPVTAERTASTAQLTPFACTAAATYLTVAAAAVAARWRLVSAASLPSLLMSTDPQASGRNGRGASTASDAGPRLLRSLVSCVRVCCREGGAWAMWGTNAAAIAPSSSPARVNVSLLG